MGCFGRSAFHIRKALFVTDLLIGGWRRHEGTAAGAYGLFIGLFSLVGRGQFLLRGVPLCLLPRYWICEDYSMQSRILKSVLPHLNLDADSPLPTVPLRTKSALATCAV